MVKVSLWTTLLGFISVLTVYSIAFSQTKDCNDLCIDDQGNILTMDPAYNIKYKPENVISIRVIRKK